MLYGPCSPRAGVHGAGVYPAATSILVCLHVLVISVKKVNGHHTALCFCLSTCHLFLQDMAERVMDSNAIERERGITILAKNTAIR